MIPGRAEILLRIISWICFVAVLIAYPAHANVDEQYCGLNAYIYDIERTENEQVITCDCAPGYIRTEEECEKDPEYTLEQIVQDTLPAMTLLEYDAVSGAAFKQARELAQIIANKNWSVKAKAEFQLGILVTRRGSYEDAVRYFRSTLNAYPDETWIADLIDDVRGLQAAQVVREKAGPIAQGLANPETLAYLPKRARDRTLIAMSYVDVGDYYAAADLLTEARRLVPGDTDLRNAEVYLSQLVAQKRERESDLSPFELEQKREWEKDIGKREAAWSMGLFMSDLYRPATARQLFTEAQELYAAESFEYRLLSELIANAEDLGHSGTPIYRTSTDAIFDALQYGRGDWERSVRFLETAAIATRYENDAILHALVFVERMKLFEELSE